jgi:ABC-type uncharacterized transport system permease subunit
MLHITVITSIVFYLVSLILLLLSFIYKHKYIPLHNAGLYSAEIGAFFLACTAIINFYLDSSFFSNPTDYYILVPCILELVVHSFKLNYGIVRLFTSLLSFLSLVSSSYFAHLSSKEFSQLPDFFTILVHIVPAMLAEVSLLLCFIFSLTYHVFSLRLKRKKIDILLERDLSLNTLTIGIEKFLIWGFVLLTVSITAGIVRQTTRNSLVSNMDPTEVMAYLSWFVFAGLIFVKVKLKWSVHSVAKLSLYIIPLFFTIFILLVSMTGEMFHKSFY